MNISDIIHSPLPALGPWPQSYLDDIHLWLASGGQAGLWRNGFDNADFIVRQRAVSSAPGVAYFGPDRWLVEPQGANVITAGTNLYPGTLQSNGLPWQAPWVQSWAWTPAGVVGGSISQRMEDVTRYAGQLCNLSAYLAWAPAAGTSTLALAVDLRQFFGSGAGASATVTTPVTTFSVTGTAGAPISLSRFDIAFTVPSIVGKYVAQAGATLYGYRNDYLQVRFTLPTATPQGTLYMAGPQFTPGPYALPYVPTRYDETWARCQRFFCKTQAPADDPGFINGPGAQSTRAGAAGAVIAGLNWRFPVRMRGIPVMTAYSPPTGIAARVRNVTTGVDMTVNNFTDTSDSSSGYLTLSAAPAATDMLTAHFTAEAEL